MRVFLQVFIPLGLFVAVLLTPIYLRRDLEKVDSDAIVDPHTTVNVFTATTSDQGSNSPRRIRLEF